MGYARADSSLDQKNEHADVAAKRRQRQGFCGAYTQRLFEEFPVRPHIAQHADDTGRAQLRAAGRGRRRTLSQISLFSFKKKRPLGEKKYITNMIC